MRQYTRMLPFSSSILLCSLRRSSSCLIIFSLFCCVASSAASPCEPHEDACLLYSFVSATTMSVALTMAALRRAASARFSSTSFSMTAYSASLCSMRAHASSSQNSRSAYTAACCVSCSTRRCPVRNVKLRRSSVSSPQRLISSCSDRYSPVTAHHSARLDACRSTTSCSSRSLFASRISSSGFMTSSCLNCICTISFCRSIVRCRLSSTSACFFSITLGSFARGIRKNFSRFSATESGTAAASAAPPAAGGTRAGVLATAAPARAATLEEPGFVSPSAVLFTPPRAADGRGGLRVVTPGAIEPGFAVFVRLASMKYRYC
eukprot:Rhum_TRINITY_DN14894_c26_g1::Rhum_TRINITY_DN14894_c26_g1_i1::g.126171::m.126171